MSTVTVVSKKISDHTLVICIRQSKFEDGQSREIDTDIAQIPAGFLWAFRSWMRDVQNTYEGLTVNLDLNTPASVTDKVDQAALHMAEHAVNDALIECSRFAKVETHRAAAANAMAGAKGGAAPAPAKPPPKAAPAPASAAPPAAPPSNTPPVAASSSASNQPAQASSTPPNATSPEGEKKPGGILGLFSRKSK